MAKILSKFGEQQLVMVNYACGLNQSEMGKYFEWIVIENINHPIIYQAFVIKNNNVFCDSNYLSLSLVLNCALYGIVSLNKLMACIPQEELFYTQKWLFI